MVSPAILPNPRSLSRPLPRRDPGRPLPPSRQRELIQVYQEGGGTAGAAKEKLVEANLGLIYTIVSGVMSRYDKISPAHFACDELRTIIDRNDLDQEGVEAFTAALDGYDPSRGRTLGAFAGEAVLHALYTALEKSRFIPMHHDVSRSLGRYVAARDEVRHIEGREPSREELAEKVGAAPETTWATRHIKNMEAALNLTRKPIRFDGLVGSTPDSASNTPTRATVKFPVESSAEEEVLAAEAEVSHERQLWGLNRALATLEGGDRAIVEDLFGLGGRPKMTAVAVARKRGVCRQRVYQLRARAFEQLRAALDPSDPATESPHDTSVLPEAS